MVMREPDSYFPAGIAWGAVAAGSLVALSAQLVLSMLGLGLGLGAVDVVTGEGAESSIISGAVGVWWIVSALVALFLGGWTAGRIAGGRFLPEGVLRAVLVWAIVMLASFYLLTTVIGTVLGGPLAVATDSVYGVLAETEAASERLALEGEPPELPPDQQEDLDELRAEEARRLADHAEGAMHAGVWAAFTMLLSGGAAVAGAWFAIDPPAWARPRRIR
jgi:hypothetical protein